MEAAVDVLTTLAKSVSTMGLYEDGHPARERVVDDVHEAVLRLQEVRTRCEFTFLGGDIVFDGRPLRALRRWDWGTRLARVGVQRIEFTGPVTRDDLEVFLDDVANRLTGETEKTAEVRQGRRTHIRYGLVGLDTRDGDGSDDGAQQRAELAASLGYTLREELDTVDWMHEELKRGGELHLLEAEALVRSLSVAMHGDQDFLIPLLRLKNFDQYTTTHAMNVSVLAMSLSEFIGLGPSEVRSFGISGLLHDLGKVTIPDEILNKPGKLTDEERLVMNNHTIEGARIIMETEDHLDLAAVVAYEHHIKLDGGGYPKLRYARRCHQASDLVHICDVFDALRTDRPYREAWEQDRVLGMLEEGAGTEFDPELTAAFVKMIRTWSHRIADIRQEDDEIVPAGVSAGAEEAELGIDLPPEVLEGGDDLSWEPLDD